MDVTDNLEEFKYEFDLRHTTITKTVSRKPTALVVGVCQVLPWGLLEIFIIKKIGNDILLGTK